MYVLKFLWAFLQYPLHRKDSSGNQPQNLGVDRLSLTKHWTGSSEPAFQLVIVLVPVFSPLDPAVARTLLTRLGENPPTTDSWSSWPAFRKKPVNSVQQKSPTLTAPLLGFPSVTPSRYSWAEGPTCSCCVQSGVQSLSRVAKVLNKFFPSVLARVRIIFLYQ